MADLPAPSEAEVLARRKALAADAELRLIDCRRQKSLVELDLREAYFFTKPRLSRTVRSGQSAANQILPKDADELCTGIGTEVNEDFATELINAFMPPHFNWCRSEAGVGIPHDAWEAVKDAAAAADAEVFKAIRASSFDAELATALVPEGGIGTVALWIDDYQAHDPFSVQHVPLRELEINIGPYGGVDDRFIVRFCRKRNLARVVPGVTIPKKVAGKKDADWVEVRWGFWLDWSQSKDLVWQHVIQIDGIVVHDEQYSGEGSCPLIVMRFAPDSLHAFGNGPTIDALPALRVVDTIARGTQDRVDMAINPSFTYDDDGTINFEGGIRSGMAYPRRPGSKVDKLYFEGDPNLGFYTLADLEKAIRRKHFADYPEQPGKTPPTATQWLDEMIKSQRRIGTPGQKFYREGPAEIFLRFRYLLEQRGVLKPLTTDDGKAVSVRPYNPASKAQEQQEVQIAVQLLGLAHSFFPVTSQAAIDEQATLTNLQEKFGDNIVVFRKPEAVQAMVQQLMGAAAQHFAGTPLGRGGGQAPSVAPPGGGGPEANAAPASGGTGPGGYGA